MNGGLEKKPFFNIAQTNNTSALSTNSSEPDDHRNESNETYWFQSLGDCQAKYKDMNTTLNNQILKISVRIEKLKRCELYFNDMFEQQATKEVLADNTCNDAVNYYDKVSNKKSQTDHSSSVFEFIQQLQEEHLLENYYSQIKNVVSDWKNFVGVAGNGLNE